MHIKTSFYLGQLLLPILAIMMMAVTPVISQEDPSEGSKKTLKQKVKSWPIELSGFTDSRHAFRLQDDPWQSNDLVLSETKLQLSLTYWYKWLEVKAKSDFIYDSHQEKSWIWLREANIFLTPTHWFDIKIGRQILTWGKGDMIFVNDLFPKDWQSFFIGREIEYLKLFSDAVKASFYAKGFELNLIYVPTFNPDQFPNTERLSFFNPFQQRFIGEKEGLETEYSKRMFDESEYHWRLRRNIKGYDIALYGYYGYWKIPSGINLNNGKATFPGLQVHGLSLEGSLIKGITHFEIGHYYSTDDTDGDILTIRNSQIVGILGHTIDFKKGFQIGMQYYVEYMLNYEALENNAPPGFPLPDEYRDIITLRLTKMLFSQKLNLSLFTFYSTTDNDIYIRPNVSYKINDAWKIDLGANLFEGERESSFWSQFSYNNNVYAGLKYSF